MAAAAVTQNGQSGRNQISEDPQSVKAEPDPETWVCFPGLKTFESADVSPKEAEPKDDALVEQKGKTKQTNKKPPKLPLMHLFILMCETKCIIFLPVSQH